MQTTQNKVSPAILTIFGMTGDLAVKKIIPALWFLFQYDRLPQKLRILGFSRRNFAQKEFQDFVSEAVEKHKSGSAKNADFSQFIKLFIYIQGTFDDKSSFHSLAKAIQDTETGWGICANKLFYLAVPPKNYEIIFQNLAGQKLNVPCGGKLGWSRILIEKPFGTNLTSALALQKLLNNYFKEEQIYRIDHYLFKEIIQGIENFRFSNNLFEHAWDNTTIDSIDIRLNETIGVEERGSFYDSVGALRDIGQNHVLSMLATLTMDSPLGTGIDVFRKNRATVLSTLAPWSDESLKQRTYRAQYQGFASITDVNPNSQTETYFHLRTELLHPKWKGVTITMEGGKRLAETRKEIVVTLKHPPVCLLCDIDPHHRQNRIIFRLAPNDEVIINFWTKKPGFEQVLEERSFSFFLYEKTSHTQYVEEYAKILNYAMKGEQSLFVSAAEVEAEWKFTDPVIQAWQQNAISLNTYEPGGQSPVQHPQSAHQKHEVSENQSLGVIGLGKMGVNLAQHLLEKGWQVYGFNRSPEPTKKLEQVGLVGTTTLQELISHLKPPRLLWLMVPHQAVASVVNEITPLLSQGDTIIDGGNSPYKQSVDIHNSLLAKGIYFLDVGVSGGPDGARYGACLMIGGEKQVFERHESLFRDLAVRDGYAYIGSPGAGHFVKMIHNGIEYGMMQALAEGFTVLKKAPFTLDLRSIACLYNHGSVITSRLVGWLEEAYTKFGDDLTEDECCSGKVAQSGEGLWTVEAANELKLPVPVISESVEFRNQSQNNPSYTGQVISALRHEFGGHEVSEK